jgi:branched-chain amino acid transport system permease protein
MALGAAYSTLGDLLALKVVAVALFAGLGNLPGGLILAYGLGLVETFVMGYLPGDWANTMSFLVIIIAVMLMPGGVFGARR